MNRWLARSIVLLGIVVTSTSPALAAHEVQRCGSGGVPKATLSQFDHDVLIQSADASPATILAYDDWQASKGL